MSGDKKGTHCHGSTTAFTDEIPTPLVADSSGCVRPAHGPEPFVEMSGNPDIESAEEPRVVPACYVARSSYTK